MAVDTCEDEGETSGAESETEARIKLIAARTNFVRETPTDARSSRRASPTSRACGLTRWTRGRPGGSSRGPTRSSIPRTTPSPGRERTRRWPGWSERRVTFFYLCG